MKPRSINYPRVERTRPTWVHDGRHETWPHGDVTRPTMHIERHPDRCICTFCAADPLSLTPAEQQPKCDVKGNGIERED